jgi:hypothetical protein
MLKRVFRQMRSEFQREIDTLSAAVRTLERTPVEHAAAVATAPPADIPKIEVLAAKPTESLPMLPQVAQKCPEIPPETEAVIKATLSAILGRQVRIRFVRPLEKPDAATTWATQGRIAIQSSHNQRASRD